MEDIINHLAVQLVTRLPASTQFDRVGSSHPVENPPYISQLHLGKSLCLDGGVLFILSNVSSGVILRALSYVEGRGDCFHGLGSGIKVFKWALDTSLLSSVREALR